MNLLKGIQVISFDVGFTLIYTEPQVGEVYAGIASRFGYRLDGGDVHARFKETWKRKNRSNRQKGPDNNAQANEERSYYWWKEIFSESVGETIAPEDLDPMFDLCYREYAKGDYWRIYPEVEETLTGLRSRGFRLVILSNWDHRLEQTLKELKLDRFFEKIYISTRIGFAKPDPGAILHIIEDLKVPAHKLLHVGDTPQEDIKCAQEAGVRSVLIDRFEKYPPAQAPQVPVISSLSSFSQ